MPIHDWTRVTPGTWHAFHLSWISEIQASLNGGLLPAEYYAQAEQLMGPYGPDVLTLQSDEQEPGSNGFDSADAGSGGVAVATRAPRTRITAEGESEEYARKRRTLVIRHSSDDRIIALLELVSPGNKSSQAAFDAFVSKAVEVLYHGFHLLIVDLFPPTLRDPNGIHAAIWAKLSIIPYLAPAQEPLTLAAYSAGDPKRAYIEPTAVGRELLEMPLFLHPETYIEVPLEATYQAAFQGVPRKFREALG